MDPVAGSKDDDAQLLIHADKFLVIRFFKIARILSESFSKRNTSDEERHSFARNGDSILKSDGSDQIVGGLTTGYLGGANNFHCKKVEIPLRIIKVYCVTMGTREPNITGARHFIFIAEILVALATSLWSHRLKLVTLFYRFDEKIRSLGCCDLEEKDGSMRKRDRFWTK